jgi:anti-sigma factor RsiW
VSASWGAPTWSCAHVREQLGAYVLDGLERDETELVAEHLRRCPACAAEHASLAGLPGLLDLAAGLEVTPPRPALEERVLDAVARERGLRRRPHRARRLVPARGRRAAAVAALAGAALGAAVTAFAMGGGDEGPAAPAARSAVPVRYAVSPHGRWGASGRAAVVPTAAGTVVHLIVQGLPADQDVVYEVRCDGPNWSASAGTFRVNRRGRAYASLSTAARPGEYESIRIVRKAHGRETAVMRGRIS